MESSRLKTISGGIKVFVQQAIWKSIWLAGEDLHVRDCCVISIMKMITCCLFAYHVWVGFTLIKKCFSNYSLISFLCYFELVTRKYIIAFSTVLLI